MVAVAGEDGTVGDAELLRAIEHWQEGTAVPGTCGKTIDDATLLKLIELWPTGEPTSLTRRTIPPRTDCVELAAPDWDFREG